MNRRTALFCSLVMFGAGRQALAGSPLVDPPTPPPCAADGTCYPNTSRWGYYPGRWRNWPGHELEPEPSGVAPTPAAEQRISPELGHSETPPADLEDAAAPPSSPKHEPPAPGGDAEETPPTGNGDGLPPGMPDVPLPDAETPPTAPLAPPTTDLDLPPKPPTALSAPGGRTPSNQATAPVVPRSLPTRVSSSDPPPAPPWTHSVSL